jgi:hypothetical protein
VEPIDLFAWVPDRCRKGIEGHHLRDEFGNAISGSVIRGSETCACPGAPHALGHLWIECQACLAEGVINRHYDPPLTVTVNQ